MLTLKYSPTQRGPVYIFQVESSFNFLSKDLSMIAYRRSEKELDYNFTHLTAEQLQSIDFVPGALLKATKNTDLTTLSVTFHDNMGVLKDQDIMVTLLKSNRFGISTLHGEVMAVAHFQAHIESSDVAICSPDAKTAHLPEADITECKFDTLTFEQVGTVVRFPAKTGSTIGAKMSKRRYENIEDNDLEQSVQTPETKKNYKDVLFVPNARTRIENVHTTVAKKRKVMTVFDLTPLLDNCFEMVEGDCLFPGDVFEKDLVFVELPEKK